MAEVVLRRRTRRKVVVEGEEDVIAIQDANTALFRRAMCEPTIIQVLQGFLDFRSLVTLLAFVDRNLRLRFTTHDPGKHIKIPLTRSITGSDRAIIRKDAKARIADERGMFGWKRRFHAHFDSLKDYGTDSVHCNTLRVYLDDVVHAKRMVAKSARTFKCFYCGSNSRRSGFKVSTSHLANKKLSPLNSCVGCFLKRKKAILWSTCHGMHNTPYAPTVVHDAIENAVRISVSEMLSKSKALALMERALGWSVFAMLFAQWDYVLKGWPLLKIYLRRDLLHNIYQRIHPKNESVSVFFEDIRETCELLYQAIEATVLKTYGFKGNAMTRTDLEKAFLWNNMYELHAVQFPSFRELFQEDVVPPMIILGDDDDNVSKKRPRSDHDDK